MKAVQLAKDGYVLRGDLNSDESPRSPASAGEPAVWGPMLGSSPPLAASGPASGLSDVGVTFSGLTVEWSSGQPQQRGDFGSRACLCATMDGAALGTLWRCVRWIGVRTRPAVRRSLHAADLKARAGSGRP